VTEVPEVHYARSGDVSIAYQIVGDGRPDIVFVRGLAGDLLSTWDQPLMVQLVEGLAEIGRVLMIDKRGTGLSDRVVGFPTLETRIDDVRAVMDAAGSERAIGARVAAKAQASEVLVSQTVKDLVAGSGLSFENAGEHELKGVPDRWHLYRVVS